MRKLLIISLFLLFVLGGCSSYISNRDFSDSEVDRLMNLSHTGIFRRC